MKFYRVLFLFFSLLLISCNDVYTSKKRGYFKIDLPEKKYQLFKKEGVPYSFEYPVYGSVVQDTTYFDSEPENPWWYNIDFPEFDARVFLSYKTIGGKAFFKIPQAGGKYKDSTGINQFDNLVNDAFKLTDKNQVVATSLNDSLFTTQNNVTGVYFIVGGNAATGRQFFVTDTTKNFLRGALYFYATPNSDSIKPVQDFLNEDIKHLINTFRWE